MANGGFPRVTALACYAKRGLQHCDQRAITSSRFRLSLYSNGRIYADHLFNKVANNSRKRTTNLDVFNFSRLQYHTELHIPKPSWSIADLEMARTHPPITQQELERLARLTLVDASAQINDRCVDSNFYMKQDLGDMVHMIQHIAQPDRQKQTIKASTDNILKNDFDKKDDPTGTGRIYDEVRGVKGIPLQEVSVKDLQGEDSVQAQAIWNEKIETKMIHRGGGHRYFAIDTNEVKD